MDRLSKVSVREIIRTAKDRHAGTQGYAEAMLLQYNKRLKYPLRWKSLHSSIDAQSGASEGDESMQISIDGSFLASSTPGVVEDNDDTDYDEFNDEAAPEYDGALPSQTLMDNLTLKSND